MILGCARVLITDQCSSRLFNCNIATSNIFEYKPVNNRTIRYAAICVLSGNVAFGQNFIPHVDTCQSAMKSLVTIKASANRVLLLSKNQETASPKCVILGGNIRYLFCKLTIFIEFRYPLSVFPGETQVLPGIIVEICRGKTEKTKTKKNRTKQKANNIKYIWSFKTLLSHCRQVSQESYSVCESVVSQFIVIYKWPVSQSVNQSFINDLIVHTFKLRFVQCFHSFSQSLIHAITHKIETLLTVESLWLRARNPKVWGSIPHGNSEFFLCPTLVTRRKGSFSLIRCLNQSIIWATILKAESVKKPHPFMGRTVKKRVLVTSKTTLEPHWA